MYILPRICSRHLRQLCRKSFFRYASTSSHDVPHVCIVGSGPAGFYTTQQILKGNPAARVDILEKLPVPFGLVRFGVAPDHPEVKNVIHTFTTTARNQRCTFIGNVEVGKDISIEDLQKAYTAVVLAYGADDDRTLAIKGEDNPNVISARSFVGWFNGLPQDKDLPVDLDVENVVILGQGNVALDVARILLTPISILQKTDISQHALDALSRSRVKKVYIVGRRGPLQVAFTIKELREMTKLPDCRPVIHKEDVENLDQVIKDLPRPRKRLTELLYKICMAPSDTDTRIWSQASREWELRFRLSPVEINQREGKVTGVQFCVNQLQGDDLINKKAVATSATEHIDCGLVFRSIGYKSVPIDPSLPFDTNKGIIPNKKGRVKDKPGLYCSGWVSTGPVGVILNTMTGGFETGKIILKDLEDGVITSEGKQGNKMIKEILESKGKQMVTFLDWDKIDEEEMKRGSVLGKPREKITDISEMLTVAKS
ncbi:NADPH:adrenodoxin oxidoreductase, mitochondrial-like isoform X1 [Saccostrea cucullata]|uniref:NADPH:adrenodoxin oxidoreductase, mitochondrial-like isoform X1 n=2 Tax=Saccostrea cuccullata TaxID=36930 RepID=UPI002ED1B68E